MRDEFFLFTRRRIGLHCQGVVKDVSKTYALMLGYLVGDLISGETQQVFTWMGTGIFSAHFSRVTKQERKKQDIICGGMDVVCVCVWCGWWWQEMGRMGERAPLCHEGVHIWMTVSVSWSWRPLYVCLSKGARGLYPANIIL